jgi:DNA polymerase V
LIEEATRLLRPLWKGGYRYARAEVILNDLVPAGEQPRLFPTCEPNVSAKVMGVLDAINAQHGRGTLRIVATGIAHSWRLGRSGCHRATPPG